MCPAIRSGVFVWVSVGMPSRTARRFSKPRSSGRLPRLDAMVIRRYIGTYVIYGQRGPRVSTRFAVGRGGIGVRRRREVGVCMVVLGATRIIDHRCNPPGVRHLFIFRRVLLLLLDGKQRP